MPRSKSKVGMSSSGGHKPILISENDWTRIESAYGHPLPPNLRAKIQQATGTFVLSAIFEVRAAPTVDARSRVKTLLSAGKTFQRALLEPTKMDGRFYAFHLVRNHIRDDRLGEHTAFPGPIVNLSQVIGSFVTACEKSLWELRDPNRAEITAGKAWRKWIRELVTLLDKVGLPASARKDSDKRKHERASPFVLLVGELQTFVPTSCRRICSESGVATAITRAKRQSAGQ